MKARAAARLLLALSLGGAVFGALAGNGLARDADDERGRAAPTGFADPADVITADLIFERTMREKGQKTAWHDTAARGAQVFIGNHGMLGASPVDGVAFINDRRNQPGSPHWSPQAVWISCDGSYAVSNGIWQDTDVSSPTSADKADTGWYVTVWQRQKHGNYKWVLEMTAASPSPQSSQDQSNLDMINARVADCPARDRHRPGDDRTPAPQDHGGAGATDGPADYLANTSIDHTLAWTGAVLAGGAASFTLLLKHEGQMQEVLRIPASPPAAKR